MKKLIIVTLTAASLASFAAGSGQLNAQVREAEIADIAGIGEEEKGRPCGARKGADDSGAKSADGEAVAGTKVTREQWKAMTPEERKAAKRQAKIDEAVHTASKRDRNAARRCGIPLEKWCAMSKKAQKAARQEALAKSKGMTVEEMKAERTRKEAERVGCPVEKWAKMSVRARIEYRKAAKAQREAAARQG